MGSIDPFLPGDDFAPEVLHAMREAFDRARRSLHDTGQPQLVQEILAGRIVRLARTGERDIQKLCREALKGLGSRSEYE